MSSNARASAESESASASSSSLGSDSSPSASASASSATESSDARKPQLEVSATSTSQSDEALTLRHGILKNKLQFSIYVGISLFAGLLLGSARTTVPLLAKREFEIKSEVIVSIFLIAFGAVKSSMNFVGGFFGEFGRRRVAAVGWAASVPIVLLLLFGPSWGYVIAATMFLGFQQGLTWSMSIYAKIDLAKPEERGLAVGIDETFGYSGVAVGAAIATFIVDGTGTIRPWPFVVAIVAVIGGAVLIFFANETLPWAQQSKRLLAHKELHSSSASDEVSASADEDAKHQYRWLDLTLLCVAGHVEKWVDSIYWFLIPSVVSRKNGDNVLTIPQLGVVVLVYGLCWGVLQLPAGFLADKTSKRLVVVLGMIACGFATLAMALFEKNFVNWTACATFNGIGMALLYPNLIAWFSDLLPPHKRSFGLGIYRTARDAGYAVGGLLLGLLLDSAVVDLSLVVVGAGMALSGVSLMFAQDKMHGPWLRMKTSGFLYACRRS